LYSASLKRAYRVTVDSNTGNAYTVNKYNLDESRVEILKFLPNIRTIDNIFFVDIKRKYKILNDYIFYPAQFWSHKNHVYILKAIKILKEEKNHY
jgi:hypothetical protein